MAQAVTSRSLDFYAGSRLLQPVSDLTGLQIDQVNFVFIQFVALLMAYPFRVQFHPSRSGPIIRHWIELLLGFALTYFCFGYQTWYIVLQSTVCLILMKNLPPGVMERTVFVVGLGSLMVAHICRQITDYAGYTLDITGPMMVNAQRVTCIGYSLADAKTTSNGKPLQPEIKKQAIKNFPSLLEYFSYIFSFHTAGCGPFVFYNDYLAFIEGKGPQPHNKLNSSNNNEPSQDGVYLYDRPTSLLQERLFGALLCAMVLGFITPHTPITYLSHPTFISYGPVYKMFYCVISTTFIRVRYYFAWKLAEAASINAGLAFNGYDENGAAKWDLIDNTNFVDVEFSTSLKKLIDNWNITTTKWLRHTVYCRVSWQPTFMVFLISAFWHGFYPGYYLCFTSGVILTFAARKVRRHVRPWFIQNPRTQFVYDCITFFFTRVAIAYMTFPFIALEFYPSWITLKAMYFWMHFAGIATIILCPLIPKPKPQKPHIT